MSEIEVRFREDETPAGFRVTASIVRAEGITAALFVVDTSGLFSHVARVDDLTTYDELPSSETFYRRRAVALTCATRPLAAAARDDLTRRLRDVVREWDAYATTEFGGMYVVVINGEETT